jgi:hypothetical protein
MAKKSFIAKLIANNFVSSGDVVRYVNHLGQTLLVGRICEKGIIVPGHGNLPVNVAKFEQLAGTLQTILREILDLELLCDHNRCMCI